MSEHKRGKNKKMIVILIAISFIMNIIEYSGVQAVENNSYEETYKYNFTNEQNINNHAYKPFDKNKINTISGEYRKDRILIKMKSEEGYEVNSSSDLNSSSFNSSLLKESGIKNLKPLFKVNNNQFSDNLKLQSISIEDTSMWYVAEIDKDVQVENILEKASNIPGVEDAQPDYIRNISSEPLIDINEDPEKSQ